jgi:V8-like Glu-specific endopeptidase
MSRYYTLKNKTFGGKASKFFDGSIQAFIESNFPTGQAQPSQYSSFTPIGSKELANMLNKYYESKAEAIVRKAHGSSDFLPFSFLSRGLRCGSPVCLLLRQYTELSVLDFIQTIQDNDYSTSELSHLLKIPNQQVFWKGHASVSEAFKEVTDMKALLTSHIRSRPIAVATCSLVGRDYILTNNHVLPDTKYSDEYIVRFRYENDFQGRELDSVDYKLDMSFFYTNSELDYTITKLSPLSEEERKRMGLSFQEAGNNFGWHQMIESEEGAIAIPPIPTLKRVRFGKLISSQIKDLVDRSKSPIASTFEFSPIIAASSSDKSLRKNEDFKNALNKEVKEYLEIKGISGQSVSIIQHPKGNRKEIVLYGNRVQAVYQDFIQYETDAEPGSSGSPIFNEQWQLVGLHHSVLIDAEENEVVGYLGTRICRIVQDLRSQLENANIDEHKQFLSSYIDEFKRGRIFISAGRKRSLAGLESESNFESDALFKLGNKVAKNIEDKSKFAGLHLDATHIQAEASETRESIDAVIKWIQKDRARYQPGDVALEILLDAAANSENFPEKEQSEQDSKSSEIRGAKVFYFRSRIENKLNAESLLRDFLQAAYTVNASVNASEQSEFTNRGAQSHKIMSNSQFCTDISMPSLVLYAGYLTNEQDRNLFQDEYLDILAEGIADGLIRWANTLSPIIL